MKRGKGEEEERETKKEKGKVCLLYLAPLVSSFLLGRFLRKQKKRRTLTKTVMSTAHATATAMMTRRGTLVSEVAAEEKFENEASNFEIY